MKHDRTNRRKASLVEAQMKGTRIMLENIITQYNTEHRTGLTSRHIEELALQIEEELEATAKGCLVSHLP